MPLILGTNSIKDTGFDVANSCRFNSGSSDYLSRTPSGTSSGTITTHSLWFKRCDFASDFLYINFENGVNYGYIGFDSDSLDIRSSPGYVYVTTQKLRDPSAWYHLVVAVDNSLGTASDRVKIYLNGSRITSFSTQTDPSSGAVNNLSVDNTASNLMNVGGYSGGNHFGGYIAEFVFIDGQALDPTSFGEFDEDTGIWKPIDVSGLTFGTNGFYLDFENSGSLGADVSGNGNNFTVNNLTSVDQSTDTCTNNFATLNPLDVIDDDGRTLSEGNLNFTTSSGNNGNITGTIAVSGSGKWYFETKISAQSGSAGSSAKFGIVGVRDLNFSTPYSAGYSYYIYSDGRKEDGANTTNSAHPGYSLNDIVQVALDLDNGNIYFGLNGNWGDNSGNFNQTFGNATAFFTSINTDGFWSAFFVKNVTADNALTLSVNFGSPSFAISSGNTDGNGYGNFEYAVPSGYFALNTKNLSEYG